jgi:sterol desaturase/sphingolipid hydroxylase (fatty acid hydroxylase superfamily)
MVVNSVIGAGLVYGILGLPVEAGVIYTLCTALGEFFYHAGWRTPRWVGYVFQRPEMHRIHHQLDYHRSNYADIVWWDMLFGTCENPAQWNGHCGFLTDDEERLLEMLAFRDVNGARAQK